MKIAQVAPLYESVPPHSYGGTERVVSYLTEELVRQGHEVTLFAAGDSRTKATLISGCRRALRLDVNCIDKLAHHLVHLERVFDHARCFDVLHFHCDYLHFPWSRRYNYCHVTTLHGRLDIPDLNPIFRQFEGEPLISISDAQRQPLAWANWQDTVYHGLPQNLYHLHEKPGQYLAFLGRISPEKRVDRAIEIAQRCGVPLRIAAKIDAVDREYYKRDIEPLIKANRSCVEFVGEIGDEAKDGFLGNACALLFPIDWPEPFGLVMIEALACGTPVIAYRHGSVPEVLEEGVTGFLVDNIQQAVHAVERIPSLSRAQCRQIFEQRFSVERMASDYLAVYRKLMDRGANGLNMQQRQDNAVFSRDGRKEENRARYSSKALGNGQTARQMT